MIDHEGLLSELRNGEYYSLRNACLNNELILADLAALLEARTSVQPTWFTRLPLQQQSVVLLAGRGPDGVGKYHPCKQVQIAYRATVFVAAKYGRLLEWGEFADNFMSLDVFADDERWPKAVNTFLAHWDELPHHYTTHLLHGAQIVGYKHPDKRFSARWHDFYLSLVDALHLRPESEKEMDERLGDWGRKHWRDPSRPLTEVK